MGTNTLETAYSNGTIIDASHPNEITQAIISSFVGRNSSGAATSGQSLGSAALPWGTIYGTSLILGGSAVDTSQLTSLANRIISGKTKSTSELAQFIAPAGIAGGANLTVEGLTTNLVIVVNGTTVTISTDIAKSSLTLAPNTNNTCLVNDTDMASDLFAGESDADIKEIAIDTVGSEITSLVGEMVAFTHGTAEILIGFLRDGTTITDVYRGFFMDDSGDPLIREALSNNDTLTLLNIGWVFAEDNGTTIDVSYTTPVWSFDAPSGPATGDYWFDITNQTWKRYSGTTFVVIDRTLIGMVALDDTDCLGARSRDIFGDFSDYNDIETEIFTVEKVRSKGINSQVSVYGALVIQENNHFEWNITTDLESPLTEQSSTTYYLYITENGDRVISEEKYHFRADLRGYYHPFNSWRCVGRAFNDSGSDFTITNTLTENKLPIHEETLTVTAANWTTDTAIGVAYETKNGWRLRYNISGNLSVASASFAITVAGVVFRSASSNHHAAYIQPGVDFFGRSHAVRSGSTISFKAGGTSTAMSFGGDVPLESKPDWIA